MNHEIKTPNPLVGQTMERIRQLEQELQQAREELVILKKELKDEARGSAVEKDWQNKQGEDYGTY